MKVYVYPADEQGCGYHRAIWVADALRRQGHDVVIAKTGLAGFRGEFVLRQDPSGHIVDVLSWPRDADVMVFQRVIHRVIAEAVPLLRAKGVCMVVDVDDDLSRIHPGNPAFTTLHPKTVMQDESQGPVSWQYTVQACRDASFVTVSAPALLERYAVHGNGRVVANYLAPHYYGESRRDNTVIGWPGTMWSHPNDPQDVGPAVNRLVHEGATFEVWGDPTNSGAAFRLPKDPVGHGPPGRGIDLLEWPHAIAEIGIGVCPLADSMFNIAKSWLKPLELAACGVPWVASARVEYWRLHKLGCGVIARDPKRWYRALRALVDSESLRTELSEAGRAVADDLRLDNHAWRWWEAWTDALALERGTSRRTRPAPV